jgi:hypothetical protein
MPGISTSTSSKTVELVRTRESEGSDETNNSIQTMKSDETDKPTESTTSKGIPPTSVADEEELKTTHETAERTQDQELLARLLRLSLPDDLCEAVDVSLTQGMLEGVFFNAQAMRTRRPAVEGVESAKLHSRSDSNSAAARTQREQSNPPICQPVQSSLSKRIRSLQCRRAGEFARSHFMSPDSKVSISPRC